MRNWPAISTPLAVYFILVLSWALSYSIFPEHMKPNSVLMRMVFLFAGAQLCGYVVQLAHLPDMLGMIFWGVLYTNVGLGNFQGFGMLEATLR